MFTVAPRGRVKLVTLRETPARFWTHSIVKGKVAEEDAVENAVRRAGDIAWKCFQGFSLPTNLRKSGRMTKA
jgi:hypothetical protein